MTKSAMKIFGHSDIRTFGASEHPSVYTIVQYLVTFCFLIAGYLLFAFSSLYLPEGRIKHAVEKSVAMGDIKTDYPRAIVNKEVCRMDQYSDALILNQAYCASKEKPIRSIMLVPSVGGIENMAEWLEAATSGVSEPVHTYPRYWHGSTYLSRWILLLCGRYANLQLFIFYVLSISIFALLLLLIKKKCQISHLSVHLHVTTEDLCINFLYPFIPIPFYRHHNSHSCIVHQIET